MVLHIKDLFLDSVFVSYCFCNKLLQTWWLKQHKLIILQFLKSESKMSLAEQKSRCGQGFVLVEALGGQSVSLPFPAPRG